MIDFNCTVDLRINKAVFNFSNKLLVAIAALFFLSSSWAACEKPESAENSHALQSVYAQSSVYATMGQKIQWKLPQIKCESCAAKIDNLFKEKEMVQFTDANVSVSDKVLSFQCNEKMCNLTSLASQLEGLGYTVESVSL